MWAMVNDQGTAMAETAMCGVHVADVDFRGFAYVVGVDADDLSVAPPLATAFVNCTGNDELLCVECPPASVPARV